MHPAIEIHTCRLAKSLSRGPQGSVRRRIRWALKVISLATEYRVMSKRLLTGKVVVGKTVKVYCS